MCEHVLEWFLFGERKRLFLRLLLLPVPRILGLDRFHYREVRCLVRSDSGEALRERVLL